MRRIRCNLHPHQNKSHQRALLFTCSQKCPPTHPSQCHKLFRTYGPPRRLLRMALLLVLTRLIMQKFLDYFPHPLRHTNRQSLHISRHTYITLPALLDIRGPRPVLFDCSIYGCVFRCSWASCPSSNMVELERYVGLTLTTLTRLSGGRQNI